MKYLVLILVLSLNVFASEDEFKSSEFYVEFNSPTSFVPIKVQLIKRENGVSGCETHYLLKESFAKFNPTKISSTNIPKFIKLNVEDKFYWFKVCKC